MEKYPESICKDISLKITDLSESQIKDAPKWEAWIYNKQMKKANIPVWVRCELLPH